MDLVVPSAWDVFLINSSQFFPLFSRRKVNVSVTALKEGL